MGKSRAPEGDEDGLSVTTNPKGLLDFDASQTADDITSQGTHATSDTLGLPPFLLMASRETLLAYLAAFLGGSSLMSAEKRKSRGRRTSVMDIEKKRAWIIWWYVRQQSELGASQVRSRTVRQLIEEVWTCHGSVPIRCSRYAAFRSKAMGLFQPKAECLRRGL